MTTQTGAEAALRLAEHLSTAARQAAPRNRLEVPLCAVAFSCLTLGMGPQMRAAIHAALEKHPEPHQTVMAVLATVIPAGLHPALLRWMADPDVTTVVALRYCLRIVGEHDLGARTHDEDILGVFYGSLRGHADLKHDQAFYTPLHVAKLVAAVTYGPEGPPAGSSVYDPACGSGTMLLAVGEVMRHAGRDPATVGYFGQDVDPIACALTLVNLT